MVFSLGGTGYGAPKKINFFRNSNGIYKTKTVCYSADEKDGRKLMFRLEFLFEEEIQCFEAKINPRLIAEKELIDVLKHNDRIFIWVVDKEDQVVKVIELAWNYKKHAETFESLM